MNYRVCFGKERRRFFPERGIVQGKACHKAKAGYRGKGERKPTGQDQVRPFDKFVERYFASAEFCGTGKGAQ
jgi:hypothetical protein